MSIFSNPITRAGEEANAYVAAVLALLGEGDPMAVLHRTSAEIRATLRPLTPDELLRPEQPGKWSALEVVRHLADSDLVWAYRMRLMVAEERPTLSGYDQDRWAARLAYRDGGLDRALEQFEWLRGFNLRFLTELPRESFERVGVHSERGEESLDHMVRLYAGHDLVHIRQLKRVADSASEKT